MPRRETAAARAVRLIQNLTHTGDYAGQPFTLRPWQKHVITQLFRTGKDGLRVHRTCLFMVPRKNGKTELAAAIAIYCLLFDGQTGGEIYLAAADREQAGKVYGAMVTMLRADAELLAEVEIIESQKRIVHPLSGSFVKAISAEAYSKHGFNASVVIYDELHAAPNRDLWDVLATSQGARVQPLLIAISTAGFDRQSILWELYDHAKNVIENPALDPTFLPIIYEAPADAAWQDEATWKLANPALGDFRSLDDMRIMAQRAAAIPAQQNTFRRLYLNQWTEQASRWLNITDWDSCRGTMPPLSGRRWYLGLDLSATKDLTGLVGVSPDPDGPGFAVRAHGFLPEARIRDSRDRAPYRDWARDGWLTITPGDTVDYERVRNVIHQWDAEGDIAEIGFDPWNATDLILRLKDQDGFSCVPIRQGFASLTAPTKALEKAVLGRTLVQDGNPVLRYCMGNVAVEQDAAGNLKPSKRLSTLRIDLAVALILGIARMDANAVPTPPKQYQMIVYGGHA